MVFFCASLSITLLLFPICAALLMHPSLGMSNGLPWRSESADKLLRVNVSHLIGCSASGSL